ncbi:replication associated protein [Miresoil virus 415]|uniref:ATP-dependent helicase Rep n=1 Tax=Miresoil virus 415 TaxID=2911459 RepID=A0A9E9C2H6_9VIRU|nr:replication associated protein [Miresoil virus 415]
MSIQKKSFKVSTITFTSYKSEDETIQALHEDGVKWYLFGREICPNTGRSHLQGMANHKKTSRFSSTKKICHIEKCMDPAASITYCKKDGNFVEWGDTPVFDKKVRAVKAKDISTFTEDDFNDQTPRDYLIYKRVQGLQRNALLQNEKVRVTNINYWYYGKTGTGKSTIARTYPDKYYKVMDEDFWDGYTGQKTIVFEDLRDVKWGPKLLNIADHVSIPVKLKGQPPIHLQHDTVVVTSNLSIDQMFCNDYNLAEPLARRFTQIEVKGPSAPSLPLQGQLGKGTMALPNAGSLRPPTGPTSVVAALRPSQKSAPVGVGGFDADDLHFASCNVMEPPPSDYEMCIFCNYMNCLCICIKS